jgi:hypothetical protein
MATVLNAVCGVWCVKCGVLLPVIEVVLSRQDLSCCGVLSLGTFCL